MKKAICILLIGIYLVSSTEIQQLVKLPILIQHFAEHKKQDKDLTLWSFLIMHYEHNTVDIDYSKDQQLPFKSHDNCSGLSLSIFVSTPVYSITSKSYNTESVSHIIQNENFIHSVYLSSIWQPPKA